jgi:hypothetical protein
MDFLWCGLEEDLAVSSNRSAGEPTISWIPGNAREKTEEKNRRVFL